jgi:hypothetical protein
MTVVKYGFEAWAFRKADEDLLDVFQRKYLRSVLRTRPTDRISNSRLHEKCCSIPLSNAIIRVRLRWLWHLLRMKDDRLPKIVLFGQPSRAKQSSSSAVGVRGCHKERFKGNGKFMGGCKEGGFE